MEKKDHKSNKIHYILLVIVLIIGIIIRFWGLGEKNLCTDEFWSYFFSSRKTFIDSFICMITDLSPPAYYIFLYWWIKLFGNSEFILRFPSFFIGVLSIIAIYFLTRKNFNKQIALGATILVSFSPFLLMFSQLARGYSLFMLFSIITVSIWIEIINKINNNNLDSKTLIKYAFSALAVIFIHYVGVLLVFFQIVYLIFISHLKKIEVKKVLIFSQIIFFVFSFFFFIHYYLFSNISSNIFSLVFNNDSSLANSGNFFNSLKDIFNYIFYNNYIFFLSIIIFLLLNFKKVKTFVISEITTNKMNSPLIYLSYIVIFPIISFLILNIHCSFLQPKHLIFILPPSYLLISFIIHSFDENKELIKNFFIFGVSIIFLAIFLLTPQKAENKTFTYYNLPWIEWSDSTKYILDNADKDSVILVEKEQRFYYTFYSEKFDKNIKKYNIVVDWDLYNKKFINLKIKAYRKKYKKIYFYSLDKKKAITDDIKNTMDAAKTSCNHLERKNFINVNLYECY